MSTSPYRDLTHRQHEVQPSLPFLYLWLCQHQAPRAGGYVTKGRLFLRCGKCQAARAKRSTGN